MALPKIGNLAPALTLKDQNEKTVTLKEFRGDKNVVLYFYPKAMTPGCTNQAKGITEFALKFKKADTVVLAVSPDESARLKRFEDRDSLKLTLLSDPEHKLADKYGVWDLKKFMGKEYMGILRTTFIIGKDGRIKDIISKVKTKTHHEDVLEYIKANL